VGYRKVSPDVAKLPAGGAIGRLKFPGLLAPYKMALYGYEMFLFSFSTYIIVLYQKSLVNELAQGEFSICNRTIELRKLKPFNIRHYLDHKIFKRKLFHCHWALEKNIFEPKVVSLK